MFITYMYSEMRLTELMEMKADSIQAGDRKTAEIREVTEEKNSLPTISIPR
jgi:hypothetical protein